MFALELVLVPLTFDPLCQRWVFGITVGYQTMPMLVVEMFQFTVSQIPLFGVVHDVFVHRGGGNIVVVVLECLDVVLRE